MRTLNYWTKNENKILLTNLQHPLETLEKLIPSKSGKQILGKIRYLGFNYRLMESNRIADKTLNLTETEKAYIAGIIDGEGTIGIHKDSRRSWVLYQPRVSIANSNRELLEWIKTKACVNCHIHRIELDINNYDVKPLLIAVIPYLHIKKKQATLMLEFIDLRIARSQWVDRHTQRELEIVQEVYRLNTKPQLRKRVVSEREVAEYLIKHPQQTIKAITTGAE